jgi:hypothetical protein
MKVVPNCKKLGTGAPSCSDTKFILRNKLLYLETWTGEVHAKC